MQELIRAQAEEKGRRGRGNDRDLVLKYHFKTRGGNAYYNFLVLRATHDYCFPLSCTIFLIVLHKPLCKLYPVTPLPLKI